MNNAGDKFLDGFLSAAKEKKSAVDPNPSTPHPSGMGVPQQLQQQQQQQQLYWQQQQQQQQQMLWQQQCQQQMLLHHQMQMQSSMMYPMQPLQPPMCGMVSPAMTMGAVPQQTPARPQPGFQVADQVYFAVQQPSPAQMMATSRSKEDYSEWGEFAEASTMPMMSGSSSKLTHAASAGRQPQAPPPSDEDWGEMAIAPSAGLSHPPTHPVVHPARTPTPPFPPTANSVPPLFPRASPLHTPPHSSVPQRPSAIADADEWGDFSEAPSAPSSSQAPSGGVSVKKPSPALPSMPPPLPGHESMWGTPTASSVPEPSQEAVPAPEPTPAPLTTPPNSSFSATSAPYMAAASPTPTPTAMPAAAADAASELSGLTYAELCYALIKQERWHHAARCIVYDNEMRRVQLSKGGRRSSTLEAMAREVPQWLALQPTSFPLAGLMQLAGMHNEPVMRQLEHYTLILLEQHTSTLKTDLQLQEMQRRFLEAATWRQAVASQIVDAMAERHSSARLVLCCLVELQRGVTLLAEGEADPESEFALSNPAMLPYLRGLAELCYIGAVCVQTVVGPSMQHIQGLAHDLQSRMALLINQLDPALQRCQVKVKQLDPALAGALKCALSNIPIESQREVAMWNGAPLHVAVANLWAHKISLRPPVIRF